MERNAMNMYQRNAIMTASPAELTLMLYDGAIKFCNKALVAMENKNVPRAHENIKRAEDIIVELRSTLNRKYKVWEDFDRVYEHIYQRLVDANISKDPAVLEDAMKYIREMRDTWKEVMRLSKEGQR